MCVVSYRVNCSNSETHLYFSLLAVPRWSSPGVAGQGFPDIFKNMEHTLLCYSLVAWARAAVLSFSISCVGDKFRTSQIFSIIGTYF